MPLSKKEQLEQEHEPEAISARLDKPQGNHHISDAILGAIDGCVTTFAIVSGAIGAGFSASVALIMGFANLIADGFSMAISNYEANKAQHDQIEQLRNIEQQHINDIPAGEKEEIRQIFARKGFSGEMLNEIVNTITQNKQLWVETMLVEEHGVLPKPPAAFQAGLTTFAAFVSVGSIPLIPLAIQNLSTIEQFTLSAVLAGCMFFMIGMFKSMIFNKSLISSGISTLLTGGMAASLAFITGYVLRILFEI